MSKRGIEIVSEIKGVMIIKFEQLLIIITRVTSRVRWRTK